jgi:hypothetical protein
MEANAYNQDAMHIKNRKEISQVNVAHDIFSMFVITIHTPYFIIESLPSDPNTQDKDHKAPITSPGHI